ncbi:MAG: hypothetical protein AB1425_00210 [Actinomycetota bacterium]
MTESYERRQQFTKAPMSELARLWREGATRIERSHVEEVGRRSGVDPDEASRIFADSRGDLWQGEFIRSKEGPGWEAVALENVPATATSPDSSV